MNEEGGSLSDYYLLTRTFLYINKRLYRETIQRLAPALSGIVLDVGCGERPYQPLLIHARRYVGLDLVPNRRAHVIADAQRLPIGDRSVDSVFCSELLEHVPDPDAVVGECARVLKEAGNLLVTAPMSWNLHYEPHDYRRYTCYGLWKLLDSHGFEIVQTRRIGGLFSVVGSRLVDGIATELYRRLEFFPPRVRHALLLFYSIPVSLAFMVLARLGDGFQRSDALGWAVLATRRAA